MLPRPLCPSIVTTVCNNLVQFMSLEFLYLVSVCYGILVPYQHRKSTVHYLCRHRHQTILNSFDYDCQTMRC